MIRNKNTNGLFHKQGRPIGKTNKTKYIQNCTVCGEEYETTRKPIPGKCQPCSGTCAAIMQRARKHYKNNTLIRCNICGESMGIKEIGEHVQTHLYQYKIEKILI